MIDEALLLIKGDGSEYIQLMGFICKTSPRFADELQSEGNTILNLDAAYTAIKTFSETKSADTKIFIRVVDEDTGTSSTITAGMLRIAKTYYEVFYGAPNWVDDQRLNAFLSSVVNSLKERPLKVDERYRELQSTEKASAPGPDGLQFSVLSRYWEQLGPILTRAANDILRTGNLSGRFRRLLITLIPKNSQKD